MLTAPLHPCQSPGTAGHDFYQQALEESLIPVRPGVTGETPCVHDVPIGARAMPGLDNLPDKMETKHKN